MNPGEVLTAMVTPFTREGDLAIERVPPLVEYLVKGCDGLVVLGTTGESPTLSLSEKLLLLEEVLEVREERKEDFSVIVGTGSYATKESIDLTRRVHGLPVDGIMLVTPYYNRPTQEGLIKHFTSIAMKTSSPIILYNVPGRTGCHMEASTTLKLSKIPHIIGIKEASGHFPTISTLCKEREPDFFIYSGDDSLTLPILSLGGHGVISVTSHLVGSRMKEMVQSFKKGEVSEALAIHFELSPLFETLFKTTNPIPIKEALNMMHINVGPPRSPLFPLSLKEKKSLEALLGTLNLISLSRDSK